MNSGAIPVLRGKANQGKTRVRSIRKQAWYWCVGRGNELLAYWISANWSEWLRTCPIASRLTLILNPVKMNRAWAKRK